MGACPELERDTSKDTTQNFSLTKKNDDLLVQLFIRFRDETLSVVATCGSDKTVCPVLGGLLAVQKGSEYSLFECPICLASSISPKNAFGRNSLDAPRGISVNPS
jgi:hypothetical protein